MGCGGWLAGFAADVKAYLSAYVNVNISVDFGGLTVAGTAILLAFFAFLFHHPVAGVALFALGVSTLFALTKQNAALDLPDFPPVFVLSHTLGAQQKQFLSLDGEGWATVVTNKIHATKFRLDFSQGPHFRRLLVVDGQFKDRALSYGNQRLGAFAKEQCCATCVGIRGKTQCFVIFSWNQASYFVSFIPGAFGVSATHPALLDYESP